jgi:hypothetical protein
MIIWNRVTWYSKYLALIFFTIVFPIWTFYLGIQYERTVSELSSYSEFVPQLIDRSTSTPIQTPTTTPGAALNSGITGTVAISPTCPVEKIPPDPNCAPKTYGATIKAVNQKTAEQKTFKSSEDGIFKVDLKPGDYALINDSGSVLPRMEEYYVTVSPNKYTEVNIVFDSGIR